MELNVDEIKISAGGHPKDSGKACAMELVSYLAKEPWSDHPQCTCPLIAGLTRRLNDRITDDAMRTELLRPILPKLIGTRGSTKLMVMRAYIAADVAIHVFAARAMDHAKLPEQAAKLRAAPEVKDPDSARRARDIAREARSAYAADAADAAAAYAAYAADAAYAAYAADAAAAYAAYAADAAAAYADAADAASRQAARRKEYELCVDLILRLCEVKDPAVAA